MALVLVAAVLMLGFTIQVNAIISSSQIIPVAGTIKSVGVDVSPTSLAWGILEPNSVTNMTVNIRGNGTAPVTLTYQVTDWQPKEAEDYMALTWNYKGQSVNSTWTPVVFSLRVHQNVTSSGITNFSFNIVVTGTG